MKERFKVLFSKDADDFLESLSQKAKDKILSNIRKAKYVLNPKLFKKLEGTDIWEFRTKYDGIQYRLLAFWDTSTNSLVVATHGFIKKVQKRPHHLQQHLQGTLPTGTGKQDFLPEKLSAVALQHRQAG